LYADGYVRDPLRARKTPFVIDFTAFIGSDDGTFAVFLRRAVSTVRSFFVSDWGRMVALAAVAATLAGCGAGGDPPADTAVVTATGDGSARNSVKAIRDNRPQVGGAWSAPFDMSVIAIHMALQPGGSVLYFGSAPNGAQTAAANYAVWDPSLGVGADSVIGLPNTTGTDIFCSSQILLQDGSTLISGGDQPGGGNPPNRESTVFDGTRRTISKGPQMNRERWYSSSMTLMNGETYVQGGLGGADLPEIRGADGRYRMLQGALTGDLWPVFPRNFIAPDGRVFGIDGVGNLYFVDTKGEGRLTRAGTLPRTAYGEKTAAAQFRPGRFLRLGELSPSATLIDIRSGTPTWRETEAVSSARVDSMATVLPDGRVLITGGSASHNQLATAVNTAEIWNPVTGEWTIGPAQVNARLYHGSALLLHDGRVLVAGGGAPGPLTNRNGEIYSPSYLFDASGARATQPTIAEAPTVLDPGRSFSLRLASGPVSRVTLVRFGTVSHSWSGDHTFVDLPFRATGAGGAQVRAQLPGQATQTPPGFYLLYAFDERGVPSIARTLRIVPPGSDPEAAFAPTVDAIPDRTWTNGPVALQVSGRSRRGAALTWSASGLPPGLAIDAATGAITGMPTRRGDHYVTVAADDGSHVGSTSFIWSVSVSDLTLVPPSSTGPVAAGTAVRLSAQAAGAGLQYEWRFGDGTSPTVRSTSPTVDHVFARPGVYTVTVTVYDAQGRPSTGSFLQVVHGSLTARPAARSSMLAISGTGNAQRLWVANPDANTVAVFDTISRARLAEIAVGEQPVTLTVAGDGRVWVANRRSATVSVIDPVRLSVVGTIALPPASQPYGVVAEPSGRNVWVVMEATGALFRYDSTSLARTGDTSVGANSRHLAITGDSSTVYSTRFITPPLPGESSATVDPYFGGRVWGARMLPIDAATMAVGAQIVLRHSDRPDAENQGRGVPNYLGAMAISPDGSQAFVPSKQDNILRGRLRDGQDLDFQNTVRAVSSRIDMASRMEDAAARIDHDNASVASAATFDPLGALLFVALETSREVAVLDAYSRVQLMRVPVGRAPQGLQVSPDGSRLYVANFMDRSVSVIDLTPMRLRGRNELPVLATLPTVGVEPLPEQVSRGKKLFYDAFDPRLARDRYMSCASCHNDGGQDGRTWDFTGSNEGLRNTISLRGRGGMRHGPLHWSGNFDEVQDFEGQIRSLAGGSGLMSDTDFRAGTRSQPMGDPKAGLSSDLDALAAYVGSLTTADPSPYRNISVAPGVADRGRTVFAASCAGCHAGASGTDSAPGGGHAVGTVKRSSGKRLGGVLAGIDTPSLSGAWATAPYLHDGSAQSLEAAITAHVGGLTVADVAAVSYLVRSGEVDTAVASRRLEGTAVRTAGTAMLGSGGSMVLTRGTGQAGALWSEQVWQTALPFTTAFDFSIDGTARLADGLAFVLHGSGSAAVGGLGACLGACGLSNWLAATLRTWTNNDGGFAQTGRWGRPLGFDAGAAKRIVGRMSVTWNPVGNRLSMSASMLVDGVPRKFADSMSVDLRSRFGATVTAGITSATGGASAVQVVSNWSTTALAPAPRREDRRSDLGGIAIGAPACVSWAEGREDCFVIGTNGNLHRRFREAGGEWSTYWENLGGKFVAGRPSCVSAGAGRLDCFAQGVDRALWQIGLQGGAWTVRSLGGVLTSDASCVAGPLGRIDCVVRGADDAMHARTLNAGAWGAWGPLGSGRTTSAPDCILDAQGVTQCFVRGTDATLWQFPVAPGTGGVRSLGGWIHGESSCATQRDGLTQCFVRGGDDALWVNAFNGIAWSGWRQETGSLGLVHAPPRCVASPERDGVDCFVVASDGTMRHRVRDGGGPQDGAWPWTVAGTGLAPEAPGCSAQRGSVQCAARRADRGVRQAGWSVD